MFKLIYKLTDKIKDKVEALSAKLDEKGQGMVEYAMILAAVAAIAVFVLYTGNTTGTGDSATSTNGGLKGAITDVFGKAESNITRAGEGE